MLFLAMARLPHIHGFPLLFVRGREECSCYCTRSVLHCLRVFWPARDLSRYRWSPPAHLLRTTSMAPIVNHLGSAFACDHFEILCGHNHRLVPRPIEVVYGL